MICDLLPHQVIVTKVPSFHKGQTEEAQPDKGTTRMWYGVKLSEVDELRLHCLAWGTFELLKFEMNGLA